MLQNGAAIKRNQPVAQIMDRARAQFGRDNHFDFPTKIRTLLSGTRGSDSQLHFVCNWIFAHMLRTKKKDPFSESQLEGKSGVIAQCLWMQRHIMHLLQTYPHSLKDDTAQVVQAVSADITPWWKTARLCLDSPLDMYELLEGPMRRKTWLQSLPTVPARLLMTHALDLYSYTYAPEIRGALSQVGGTKFSSEKFLENDRVKRRFFSEFSEGYKKLVLKYDKHIDANDTSNGVPKLGEDEPGTQTSAGSAGEVKKESQHVQLERFKQSIETHCRLQFEDRVVVLTLDGRHEELQNSVTSTEMYTNLSQSGCRFMGFYDVKNAKLCELYEGELLIQREPMLDVGHFQQFLDAMSAIMKDGQDVCWILAGRLGENEKAIKTELHQQSWKFKTLIFVYDCKLLEKFYWRKCRGFANGSTHEKAFFCWKGSIPKGLPTERWYVNRGSSTYVEVMLHVPVAPPTELAFVEKGVRDMSLKSLIAAPSVPPAGSAMEGKQAGKQADKQADDATQASNQDLKQHLKKRRLYRQASNTTEVWFPLDNAKDLLKELVWEAGGNAVKWVCHGTPAAGNGIVGILEMGCNVLTLCQDDHHKNIS